MSYKEGGLIQSTTDVTRLVVKEGNCSITVRAVNTAGYGPAAHLSFSTQRQKMLVMTCNYCYCYINVLSDMLGYL